MRLAGRHRVSVPVAASGHPRRWTILLVLCLTLCMVVVDNTVLSVALPSIRAQLHATETGLQWITTSYSLVLAGLLLPLAVLGDRLGRKGTLIFGLVVFGIGSSAGAFVHTTASLAILRAVMGVGGASAMPATLSIIGNVFPAEERARAIGLWAGLAGTAAAVGPVAGGLLLEHFWWGSVLLVNAPLVLVALLGTALVVPPSRDVAVPPIDIEGSLLWAGALAAALYAIIEGPVAGWVSPRALVGFAGSSVLLVGFHRRERAAPAPLLSARTARSPSLQGGVIAVAATFFAVFGGQFVLTQWYQGPAGLGPLSAGLCFVPQAVGGFVGSLSAPRVASRVGHVTTSIGALMLVTVGLVATAITLGTGSVAWTAGCFGLVGLGCGGVASAVELIMSSAPAEQAGTASGINETVVEGGGALGVAVLGSVLALGYGPSAALPVAAMVGAGAVVALSCVTRRLPYGT